MIETLLDKIGDWNPQLLRELKGRLTYKNTILSLGLSAFGQIFFYLNFKQNIERFHDFHWPLYLLIALSIIGIIFLLVGGVYLLIDDLYREEKRGTLNFIRLTPQTSKRILVGKILGVPILVYLGIFFAVPLHFGLGIYSRIPAHLIVAFYIVIIVSCFLFYSAALLYTLSYSNWKGSPAFSGSILIFVFTFLFALRFLSTNLPFPIGVFNWLSIFYPGYFLHFLLIQTPNSGELANYLGVNFIAKLTWFSLPFWSNAIAAFIFTLANYFIVISWLWHGINRRFHNRSISLLSKGQSYWLSSSIIIISIGFSIQNNQHQETGSEYYYLFKNFSTILILQLLLLCGLIAALSPHRKTLKIWSRYRHQTPQKNLLRDLLWGEQSPAIVAIALNLISTSTILLSAIFLLPFAQYRLPLMISLCVSNGVILLYGSLVQWILLQKIKQRVRLAIATVVSLSFVPLLVGSISEISLSNPALSIISIFPILELQSSRVTPTILFSLVGQGIAIALINIQMTRQLRHLGESETKVLLLENTSSQKQRSGIS